MPITTPAELKLLRAARLFDKEGRDAFNLSMLAVTLADELEDFHNWGIDQGTHDCDGIPGGCPVLKALEKTK